MTDQGGSVSFTLDEIAAVIEDLMRIADDLLAAGDEVNAFLLDQVVNNLLTKPSVATVEMTQRESISSSCA